jgi:Flp pilus assembly protein TadD
MMQEGNPLMALSPRPEDDLMARGAELLSHKKSKSVAIVGGGSGGGSGTQSTSPASASPDPFVAPQKITPQPVAQPVSSRAATSSSNPLLSSGGQLTRQDSRDLLPGSRNQILNLLGREGAAGSGRLSRKGSLAQPMDEATKARMDGDALMKRKRPVEAFDFYNRAIALEPENPGHYVNRAVAHLKVESFMLAVVDCETALGFDPLNGAAYARKAKALLAMGRNEEAAECFEKARAIDPKLKELKKMNLTDMRNLRQMLKNKQSNSNLRPSHSAATPGGVLSSSRPAQALFGVSLADLMAAQKPTHPDLAVPEVLLYLIDRLSETGGLKSEGIFRLSIGSVELQTQLTKLSNGRRDLETRDANAYAVILKHFFRHLPEPLCPDFEACMAVVNDYGLHDTSASLRRRKELSPLLSVFSETTLQLLKALWDAMTLHARNAALLLFRLFDTLLVPEHAKATKMSLDNLALVFANGVLRDPDPSAISALASQPNCQRFVTYLYTFVIESQQPGQRILSFPVLSPNYRVRSPTSSSSDTGESTSPLTRSSDDNVPQTTGGASAMVAAARKRASLSTVSSLRSSDEVPPPHKGSMDDRLLGRFKPRKSSSDLLQLYANWTEFFEQAGLSPATGAQYSGAFEREKLDVNSALELFGGRVDNSDLFKSLGMKSSHVGKAQKFVRMQKGGSLGGRGSTFRMPGRSSPTPSPPGSARVPLSPGSVGGAGDNDFTGLI